ncbi:hypothetical protein DdX_16089 [Ditylenchus destructor]|uniref:Uncharacterized protein n=1 Tax=Ditylenchus destructor TaxID=166010 RepID=A0AAD4MP74_9BILA|nr:hypothetical protein DdX_16089 [Ditylenchus destructor]
MPFDDAAVDESDKIDVSYYQSNFGQEYKWLFSVDSIRSRLPTALFLPAARVLELFQKSDVDFAYMVDQSSAMTESAPDGKKTEGSAQQKKITAIAGNLIKTKNLIHGQKPSEVGPLRVPHFARKRLACISGASCTAISGLIGLFISVN